MSFWNSLFVVNNEQSLLWQTAKKKNGLFHSVFTELRKREKINFPFFTLFKSLFFKLKFKICLPTHTFVIFKLFSYEARHSFMVTNYLLLLTMSALEQKWLFSKYKNYICIYSLLHFKFCSKNLCCFKNINVFLIVVVC